MPLSFPFLSWLSHRHRLAPALVGPRPEAAASEAPSLDHISEQVSPTAFAAGPVQEDWYWGRWAMGGEEDYFWRRLSDNWYQKDPLPTTYLELHNQCYEAYNANPLAFAIIEITTSFVMGKGVTIAARDPRVQSVLLDFWYDPENHMETRVYSLCTELALYGEQFIRFFVNPYDGRVTIRQIDPSLIDQIETDPEDIEKPLRFHRRPIGPALCLFDEFSQTPFPSPSAETAADPSAASLDGQWFKAGEEVIQFAINKVSSAKRGKSDLATLLPWLRRYKDWLTDRVRINKYKGAFLWDVRLQGADRKTIERKKMEYSYPPEPGSVIIHNEAETWSAIKPEINAGEAAEDGRAIKLMIAVGAQLPEHYLADGSYGNRATAAEMGLPTLLKFQRRQYVMRAMLRSILDRVLQEACRAGRLSPEVDRHYDIIFPEIEVTNHATLASAVQMLVSALSAAKGQGWISDETAMRLIFQFAGEEIDVHEERKRISQQSDQPKP
ncbi:MAG: hypothetical protein IRZ24_11460 [Thermogemmatispora sp.]|uniref:hypothetical protein n=3 Tax=Thermogemmatispora sp. TaxID=1968838 RepID=UPI001D52E7DC|nr:hypothetical protein [Thermogemmatispora sp.]MBX5450676.1 hypothetical protein [Thermogemmatispora sp.]